MHINIPKQVSYIINCLEYMNHHAYLVGGCVRDSLLGKEPHDWDITTDALPDEIIKCFTSHHIINIGLSHGTLAVVIDDVPYEITTYRVDGDYLDNRHPNKVRFVDNLKDDLSRRDFTINAMAYNPSTGLVDYFEGLIDLNNHEIRCVGDPNKRFQEDALRIMRALRFASTLNFSVDPDTSGAILNNKDLLKNISVERISSELNKLIVGDNASRIMLLYTPVLEVFIPEISDMIEFDQHNKYHYLDVWEHTIYAINNSPNELILRLALLFHDIAKPLCYIKEDDTDIYHFNGHPSISSKMSTEILKRLKYDTNTISEVSTLIEYHDVEIQPTKSCVKRWLNKLGYDMFIKLLKIKKSDIKAQSMEYMRPRLDQLDIIITTIITEILDEDQCFRLKDLKINGYDLISAGVKEGKEIGITLNEILQLVIDEKLNNDKAELLAYVQRRKDLSNE